MTQLEIYKEALIVMRDARDLGIGYWESGYRFAGLCALIFSISDSYSPFRASAARMQLIKDSEKLLGRELPENEYWFTEIKVDEPRARAERIEHLNRLIKLYE